MAKQIEAVRYLIDGAGAVVAQVLVPKIPGAATILGNSFLQMGFNGITVAGVLLAAIGVGVAEYFLVNK